MKAVAFLLVFMVSGCGNNAVEDYTCTEEQMQKVQRECNYQIKIGYEPVFAFAHSVKRNCEPKPRLSR